MFGALIAGGLAYGYDQYRRNVNRSEKREFLDYSNAANYGYYLKSLRESPLAQREGLEKAGYNPLLALGNIGSSSFSGSSAASGDLPISGDLVGSAREGSELGQKLSGMFKLEKAEKEEQVDVLKNTNEKIQAEKKKIEAETKNIDVNTLKTDNETGLPWWNFGLDAITGLGVGSALGAGASVYGKHVGKKLVIKDVTKSALKAASKAASKDLYDSVKFAPLLGWSLPWLTGSAASVGAIKAGEKAQKTIREDKNSDYNRHKNRNIPYHSYGGGIPSYFNF